MTSGEHPKLSDVSSGPIEIDSDRYQLLELLGRGGMGEVHKAFDPRLGRHVALKVMRDAGPQLAARLVSEARSQARVEHANVCKVYGVGELNGLPFIALQYIEGDTSLGVILKVLHEEPQSLRALEPSIPQDLETICMRCLEKDPARRYDSARALAQDLQAWLDGDAIKARQASLGYRLAKKARKH